MNSSITNLNKGQVKINVSLSEEECQGLYHFALTQVSYDYAKKGFRKGKVPQEIVEAEQKNRIFYLYEELALEKSLNQALRKEKIIPTLRPEIKILKSSPKKSFDCEIIVIPYPEVKLAAYDNLKIKQEDIKVNPEEIDKALAFLRESRAQHKPVNRAAKEGDHLEISFDAYVDGKKNEAGSTEFYPLRLGKSHLNKDFEKNLYGMKPREKKTFMVSFSDEWPQKEFSGKKVQFKVSLKSLQEVVLPALDEKFAQSLGNFSDLEALKNSLREGLAQERRQEQAKQLKEKILDQIVGSSQIDIPEVLIEKEADRIFQDFKKKIEDQKLHFDKYLKRLKTSDKKLKDDFAKEAEKRLKRAFAINEIAKTEKLFPQESQVEEFINQELKRSQNRQRKPEDIDLDALRSYTFEYLTNQNVTNWLLQKNICV